MNNKNDKPEKPLISAEELDRIFDEGEEDIIDYLDFSTARRPGLEENKITENYQNQLKITTKEYLDFYLSHHPGLKANKIQENSQEKNIALLEIKITTIVRILTLIISLIPENFIFLDSDNIEKINDKVR